MMAADSPFDFPPPPPPPQPPASTTGDLETLALDGNDPLLHPPPSPPSPTTLLTADDIDLDDGDGDGDGEDVTNEITFSTNTTTITNSSFSSAPEFINITVSDPQKEHDPSASVITGSATFVSYLITSRSAASPNSAESRVRRRFRDVVALADRLAAAHKGLFVPARPDKSLVEGQVMRSQEFVGHRRIAIEKYLRLLAAHPVIGRSEELRTFLKVPGRFVTAVTASSVYEDEEEVSERARHNGGGGVSDGTAAAVVKGGRDLFGMFKDLKQTVVNGFVAVRPAPVEEEDQEFLKRKAKLQELEQQLTTTSQLAEALVKAQEDFGNTMGDLGMTLIKVGKFETEEAICSSQRTRAADIKNFTNAVLKASRLQRALNKQIVKYLHTLHEYLGLIISAHSAFTDRSNALLSVQTLSADLLFLHTRAGKLESVSSRGIGQETARYQKIDELKETIRRTEEAKSRAVREYEIIKENNMIEIERFDKERRRDFIEMLKGFVKHQVGYSENIATVWSGVAEETKGYARKSN